MPAHAFDGAMPLTAEERMMPVIDQNGEADEGPARLQNPTLYTSVWQRSSTDEVVISGMSCRLPESDNVNEFRDHLMNHDDMVTDDGRRWTSGAHGLPTRTGKLKDLSKFDATFFGVHSKQAARMDPQVRMLLEVTFEAIVDSGNNPESMRGSNTGVFVGASSSEAADAWTANAASTDGFSMIGCQRGMFSNRLSYFFDFKGPSFTVDTACSSSLLALDHALLAIRTGQCDAAIVAGASICIKPATAVQFNKLTMLSPDGACKSFDESGNGYARSEGIVAMFLQKHNNCKRVYAQIIHSKTNSDGAKEDGKSITYPSGQVQKTLMAKVYEECGVHPRDVVYVEAHGTGTKAGDPEEINSITDVFCKERQSPLLVGSTKSNMGHPEPASGLAALTKVLISSEEQMIPANLHYNNPNPEIPGLMDGRLSVVSENTNWNGGLVAINSFGFGGTNVHSVLNTRVTPVKETAIVPKQVRLLTYCGRTEESLQAMFENINSNYSEDDDLHALLSQSSSQSYMCQPYRGFTLLNHSAGPITDVKKCSGDKRKLWYIFTGMGCQWFGMAKDLMQLDVFAQSISRADEYLSPYNIDLSSLLTSDDSSSFSNLIHSFVSIAAIQVALVDTLSAMGLSPDGVVGHSVGELGCGYADGSLTAKETILAAYWRGRCILDAELDSGSMAAVGLTWKEAKERCPPGVVPACHNAEDTVTISGPADAVRDFVAQLKDEGCFAKEVSSNGVAFHSYYMSAIAPKLRECLAKVIEPKRRGARWISTSIPREDWGSQLHQYSSADYHVNNLVSPVLFQEALSSIPAQAVTVEIAPHALLQALLKRSLGSDCLNVGLQKRGHEDNLKKFYESVGELYQAGFNPNVAALYGSVSFPVPRGTPSLSSLIQWDHSVSHDVPTEKDFDLLPGDSGCGRVAYTISIEDNVENENRHLVGHKIDGRILYPATGYLVLAWKTLALSLGREYENLPVRFDDVKIEEATILQKEGDVTIFVSLLPSTGAFEIIQDDKIKVSGKISAVDDDEDALLDCPPTISGEGADNIILNTEDVYQDLRLRGYEYEGQFRGIVKTQANGESGWLRWDNDWISFLDTMLQITILGSDDKSLRLPTRINNVRIDPKELVSHISATGDNQVLVSSQPDLQLIQTVGVQLFGLHTTVAPRRKSQKSPVLETYEFVADERIIAAKPDFQDYLDCCSFAAYSSLKCVGDNAKALRVPNALITQLSQLYKENRNVEAMLEMFPKDQRFGLLDYLRRLSEGCNDPGGTLFNLHEDVLLNSIYSSDCLKPAIDLVLENSGNNRMKLIELARSKRKHWYGKVLDFYDNSPLIRTEYTLWVPPGDDVTEHSDQRVMVSQSEYSVNHLPSTGHDLVLVSHLLQVENFSEVAKKLLKERGFMLTVEYNIEQALVEELLFTEFDLIYRVQDSVQTITLWRTKPLQLVDEEELIVSGFGTDWLEPLKEKLSTLGASDSKRLWVVAGDSNGAIGLVNCLRQEEMGEKVRCIFNAGSGRLPARDSPEMRKIKQKDLVMNVYNNGTWGSYRHLPLQFTGTLSTRCANVNVSPGGSGLSSLRWIESPMKHSRLDSCYSRLCTVSYAALNFRDVMLATGKLAPESIPGYEKMRDCLLGMEFSGWCEEINRRVMGLCSARALATVVDADERFLWDVPSDWCMSDAATVPVVYSTAYYALIVRGRLRAKESVLIHSGSGGVGQAAIAIALSLGCKVFTTVGNEEKKKFLLARYPDLRAENILNSRSQKFEFDMMRLTKGKGVQVVLNSLAEEKLQASVRVLSQHGRFLEIGKFDLSNNSSLGMAVFLKNTSFHGILLDSLFDEDNMEWEEVRDLVSDGIRSGVVKPLSYSLFEKYQIEEAFRFMASGKHIGKVLVEVQKDVSASLELTEALPRYFCHPDKSYLIVGGLGGFGLQLAQWLASRGARKLILTSRSGVRNGYQAKVLEQLRSRGVDVRTSTRNAACYTEAKELLHECMSVGPMGGLFNLAMVLKDSLIENQTESSFKAVFEPKVTCTLNLDSLTRELCADSLECFVVFSSISGGRGNAGQSNYGFANTAMERMCEKRCSDGFPGLAIQWGAIGDVGVVITSLGDNDTEVGGTLPQRISSCLSAMDKFLCYPSAAVLSSYVVADKKSALSTTERKDIVASVFNILGINDVSSVSNDSTLGSLGLDSLMAVEVKQVLEREFDLNFTMKEIRALTITSLRAAEDTLASKEESVASGDSGNESLPSISDASLFPSEAMLTMKSAEGSELTLFMVHPIEGHVEHLLQLASQLNASVYGLQCTKDAPLGSIELLAAHYVKLMKMTASTGSYNIVGYSFGATVAFEMCLQLQNSGDKTSLTLLDGSHSYVKMFTSVYSEEKRLSVEDRQLEALCSFLERTLQIDNGYQQIRESIKKAGSFEERLSVVAQAVVAEASHNYDLNDIKAAARSYYSKLLAADVYTPGCKLEQKILLVKAEQTAALSLANDYGLSDVCDNVITTSSVGNHVNFITDDNSVKVASLVNQWLESQ